MEFEYFCFLQQSRVRIRAVIYPFSLRQIQDRNRDSQLSLFLPFKWGLNSSDASSVSDVRDASNANKVSVPIFVSDANKATLVKLVMLAICVSVTSNANGSLSSNIRDDIHVMMSVTLKLVMLVNFVSVASNANGSLCSNIRDDIHFMMSVTLTLVMLVNFGSVASNANGSLSSNNAKTNKTNISSGINDVINAMSPVVLVMV